MIVLGQIVNLQGKKGELRFKPLEGGERLLSPGTEIYLKKEDKILPFQIESIIKFKKQIIIKLKGIDSTEDALFTLGQEVLFPEEKLPPLGEGEFYEYQLIGASVKTRDNQEVGQVIGFWEVGMKRLMVVVKDKKEILVPFEEAICLSIDPEKKLIIIDPPDGLLNLNEI
ncbi:MAG: ribosome maturation factor RimM [Candidatus Aminicenantes bacterium]|nr:ribosome maturation factor RimM [Candidatus Aminicenantes bacterium]